MLSDQHVLSILTQSKDATAIYDSPDLHIRFVNEAMLRIWGNGIDVLGKTFEEALPETADQPFAALLKNVWKTGESYVATETLATLVVDGRPRTSFFDFEYRAIPGPDGKTVAILHSATDVSSRVMAWQQVDAKLEGGQQLIKALSQTNSNMHHTNDHLSAVNRDLLSSNERISRLNFRLQESETDFKRLVEQAPVAILVFRGEDMVIDLVNEAMLEIIGKDGSIVGMPLLAGLPELEGEPAVSLLFDVYRSGVSQDGLEAPVRMMRDGQMETRYFNFSYRALRDHGRIIGVMDVAVEVTDQVLARKNLEAIIAEKTALEQNLRANQQRLQGILDTMAEGVIIVDEHGRTTYANAMAQRIMGLDEASLKDRTYNDLKWRNERLDGTELPAGEHPMYRMLQERTAVYDQEIAIRMPGRDLLYISVNTAPLIDEGRLVGGIVTFTDVTNRRRVLQQKDDFISVASHELKTPVTSLKAALQLLAAIGSDVQPDVLATLVGQANKSLNKLSNLVNSLLNSNRISQGRFPLHKTSFVISDLINESCQHIQTAGHPLVLEGDLTLRIRADEQLLDQVIVNLVNNAVKYAPGSGKIVIGIAEGEGMARISVADSGPGIAPDKIPHIFDRYYQGAHTNRKTSGLGLGLYIAAEIIEKHGGQIGVDSEPGVGSTFWFTLPLA